MAIPEAAIIPAPTIATIGIDGVTIEGRLVFRGRSERQLSAVSARRSSRLADGEVRLS